MNTSHGIDQVDRYLRELSAALSGLSANDRDEVVAGIREHIDAALSSIERPSADDIDRVLRHLGDPLAIAAETTGRLPLRPAESLPMLERDWIPAATVLSLIMGTLFFWAVVPLVLWLLGLVLLWISPLWHLGEKILGTLAFPAVILAIACRASSRSARPAANACRTLQSSKTTHTNRSCTALRMAARSGCQSPLAWWSSSEFSWSSRSCSGDAGWHAFHVESAPSMNSPSRTRGACSRACPETVRA
jgi:uncharacterized membrane protein